MAVGPFFFSSTLPIGDSNFSERTGTVQLRVDSFSERSPQAGAATHQDCVVLLGQGDDAALQRALLVGLLDANVDHLGEVAVRLQLLKGGGGVPQRSMHARIQDGEARSSFNSHFTHFLFLLLLLPVLLPGPGPLDALVARHHDGDLAPREVADLEALQVEGGQQRLQAHQVLELEVADGGPAVAEALDEPHEAAADPLAGQHIVLLDALLRRPRQEGLVAVGSESGRTGEASSKYGDVKSSRNAARLPLWKSLKT